MTQPTSIHHVTLLTGNAVARPRTVVPDAMIDALSELLDSILMGGRPELPFDPSFRVSGTHEGSCLIVTLWKQVNGTDAPLLTTAVALDNKGAARLWKILHQPSGLPCATDPKRPPKAPWIADRIELGAAACPEAFTWTGDWARCLGWAWAVNARRPRERQA